MNNDEQIKVYRTTANGYIAQPVQALYNVVRMYYDAGISSRIIRRGLTLNEVQAHCRDPETSSSTCTKSAGLARTRRRGPWFDGYEVG